MFFALLAALLSIVRFRSDYLKLSEKLESLKKSTQHFEISNPELLYVQEFERPVISELRYRIAVPRDMELSLVVSTGTRDGRDSPFCRARLKGPADGYKTPEQYNISIYLQNRGDILDVCLDTSEGLGLPVYGVMKRLDFLDHSIVERYRKTNFQVQEFDPGSPAQLFYYEEPQNENAEKAPRYLKVEVRPEVAPRDPYSAGTMMGDFTE